MDPTLEGDLQKLDAGIAKWGQVGSEAAGDGDADLAGTYRKDCAALRSILALARQGHLAAAGRAAQRLDTVVRDRIPVRLYNALCKAAGLA